MYDPSIGRWLSEDPIGFDGGDPNLYRYVGNSPANATDPTGLIQAGNPLNNLFGGYSGNKVTASKPINPYVGGGGLSLGTLGSVLGNSVYNAAANYVAPTTRAAIGGGVSFAAASTALSPPLLFTSLPLFDSFAQKTAANHVRREQEYQSRLQANIRHDAALSGLYGPQEFKQAELNEYNRVLTTPLNGVSLNGINQAMTRMEDDVLRSATGYTRTEAAVDLTKFVIRGTGQDIVRSDQWFAAQPGTRYLEAGIGMASNPLTYAPFVAGAVSRFRSLGFVDDVFAPSTVVQRTNAQLVQDVATRADAWASRKLVSGTPQQIGTAKHAYARDLLDRYQDIFGQRSLSTEVRYVNQDVWRAQSSVPTRGSVILDVVDGPIGNPAAVYDYKFGAAGLTNGRVNQIRSATGFRSTPIFEVRP